MITDFFALGEHEIANSARLRAYLEALGSPLILGDCFCPAFSNETVDDGPYTTPDSETEPAPWYDADVPESSEFVGVLLLDVQGIDDNPLSRTVTRSASGTAAFGPARELPLTLTLSMLVIGTTCCGAQYGLKWLASALQGCTGTGCGGDCATLYNCCPSAEDGEDVDAFNRAHRRTLRRVALTEGPTVISREGGPCGGTGCKGSNGEVIQVEAVIVAATPWQWTDSTALLSVALPTDDNTECTVWCIHGSTPERVCLETSESCSSGSVAVELTDGACSGVAWPDQDTANPECAGGCRLSACPTALDGCSDPRCRTATPPSVGTSDTCFCEPLAVNQEWYEIDLTNQPRWFGSAPMIELYAGATALRNVTIKIFERKGSHLGLTCEEVAKLERCNPFAVYNVSYVPPLGTVTIDGQVGRAFLNCDGVCIPSGDTHGANGGPLQTPLMDCDKYCVEVTADAWNLPDEDALLTFSVTGREY